MEGAQKAYANVLFEDNVKLVYFKWNIWKNSVRRDRREDLLQHLLMAFWNACNAYDPTRGATFRTYVDACLRNAYFAFVKKKTA